VIDCCIFFFQILTWWFNNKSAHHHGSVGLHGNRGIGGQGSGNGGSSGSAPHAAAGLCDEVVTLWRLAALNPSLTAAQRNDLSFRLSQWQKQSLDRLCKVRQINSQTTGGIGSSQTRAADVEAAFPGFRPAIEACQLDWTNLALPGGVADLLKYRSHWGQVSGAWVPSRAGSAPVANNLVGIPLSQSGCNDCDSGGKEDVLAHRTDNSTLWLKDSGRKVLMPSERSPHLTILPAQVKCIARRMECEEPDSLTSDTSVSDSKQLLNGAGTGHHKLDDETASSDQSMTTAVGVADQLHLDETSTDKQLETSLSSLTLDDGNVQTESNSASRESKQEVRLEIFTIL
jgi:hypothetical protein